MDIEMTNACKAAHNILRRQVELNRMDMEDLPECFDGELLQACDINCEKVQHSLDKIADKLNTLQLQMQMLDMQ